MSKQKTSNMSTSHTARDKARLNIVSHLSELVKVGLERSFGRLYIPDLPQVDLSYLHI